MKFLNIMAMRKDENQTEILAVTVESPVIKHSPENVSNPVLSKQSLHDYFADKMAAFSIIVGYIFEKLQALLPRKGPEVAALSSLHKKLERLQSRFLLRYHHLTSKTGSQLDFSEDLLKPIFEHINRFEKKLISEVLNAGIEKDELQELNEKHLLFLSMRN